MAFLAATTALTQDVSVSIDPTGDHIVYDADALDRRAAALYAGNDRARFAVPAAGHYRLADR